MSETVAVVLAAGKGTRMCSRWPKVLHRAGGKPLVQHVLAAAKGAGVRDIVVVVGYGGGKVREELGSAYAYALQEPQLGTGHALLVARDKLPPAAETVLVLCGDTPLLTAGSLVRLLEVYQREKPSAALLTACPPDPSGYGRVMRGPSGRVERIVEERDASPEERAVGEVNAGVYCFAREDLLAALERLQPQNAQGEYYLTDVVAHLAGKGGQVEAVLLEDYREMLGVNTRAQLAAAEALLRERITTSWMEAGVTIVDPSSTFIGSGVSIGRDTVIYPWTVLEGESVLGEECRIGPQTTIRDCRLGDGVVVFNSVLEKSLVDNQAQIGPFAYLRPGNSVGEGVKVGDFVELKNTRLGCGSKVPHLSYLGDTTVGEGVNVGAGTITCNYDGREKWPTVIEDGAFIGSNANLVAPVKVGRGAVVGAGSTITEDVPPGALGVARGRQRNVEGWSIRKGLLPEE